MSNHKMTSFQHLSFTRPIPTVAAIGGVIEVTYLLDMPHGYEWKGVYCDANLRTMETVGSTVDWQKTFMRISALEGSVLEHRIFEDDFKVKSVSTAKLFGIAGSIQPATQILTINKANIGSILPNLTVDDNIKEE